MSANNDLGVPSRVRNFSYLQLDTYSASAAVNGIIFANKTEQTGSAFTYVSDPNYGAVITIGEDGIYAGSCTASGSGGGSSEVVIIYNDPTFSQAAVSLDSIPSAMRLAYASCAGAAFQSVPQASFYRPLMAGTKIYMLPGGGFSQTSLVRFSICKLDY